MNTIDKLQENYQSMFLEIQQEIESILMSPNSEDFLDIKLLEKLFAFHIHRSQESLVILCKLIKDYQSGKLDNEVILSLAQWT